MNQSEIYVGARYVPVFTDDPWSADREYEPLTVVLHEGSSYTSRQFVPEGIDIGNELFWARTGDYNAQVEAYREETRLKPFAFNTVADMQNCTVLFNGAICHTNGFHSAGDGGAAWYVVSDSGTANGMDVIGITSNESPELYASLIIAEKRATPEMFGAWGDGEHDDTEILLFMIQNNAKISLINSYYITDSILKATQTLDIKGNFKNSSWYSRGKGGKIIIKDGVSVFKGNAYIHGQISGCAFVGEGANGQTSDTTQYLFDTCTLQNFKFNDNYVYNFEAVFKDSDVSLVSIISDNNFLSCYYFAKTTDNKWHGVGDSYITGNYINGGAKYHDNACFQWTSFPASVLSNNFIDFYRTIFDPSADGAMNNVTFNLKSIGDRYEVFRYLISHKGIATLKVTFTDINITHVNVNNGTAAYWTSEYEPYTYTYNNVTYDLQPFLFRIPTSRSNGWQVIFDNVSFYDYTNEMIPINIADTVPFDADVLAQTVFNFANRDLSPNLINRQESEFTFYGKNKGTLIKTNFIKQLETEPVFVNGYNQTNDIYPGITYIYSNNVYKCIKYYDSGWKIGLKNMVTGNIDYHN